jgi:hypothetical protein
MKRNISLKVAVQGPDLTAHLSYIQTAYLMGRHVLTDLEPLLSGAHQHADVFNVGLSGYQPRQCLQHQGLMWKDANADN